MSVIEDVKQKVDIIEVIGQYTQLKKAGRTYRGLCPFHNEKTPSFFVYPEQQSWHCFGACNTGGDVYAFIMKKLGVEFGEALRFLADRAGVVVPDSIERQEGKEERDRLYEANQTAAQYFHKLLIENPTAEKARLYLAKRGLSLKTIVQFQLGYALNDWGALQKFLTEYGFTEQELLKAGLILAGEDGRIHDRFRYKIMIPIFDSRGRVTGFGSRVLDDSNPKYINSPQTPVFDKSGSLYGINFAAEGIRKQDMVVIVEGYMDVMIAHQFGFNNVVAPMGTAITEKQINIIKRLTKNVTLALDSDSAGEEAMLRGVNYENALNNEIKVVLLPEGKDPDEVIIEDTEVWQELIDKGIPVVDYVFTAATTGLNLNKVQDKTAVANKLLPVVGGISNDIRRDHYLNKLAEITGTSYRSMESALGKLKTSSKSSTTGIASKEKEKAGRLSLASPVEEYLLSLLLQHPELRNEVNDLPVEYFENSENKEIFLNWLNTTDIAKLKGVLDNTIQEHFELLLAKTIPETQIDKKFADCSSRLREQYYRNLEKKKAQVLTLERETGGIDAELAKLEEQGTNVSDNLKTIFTQRGKYQKR